MQQAAKPEVARWFVMCSPVGKEMKIEALLREREHVQTFLPLKTVPATGRRREPSYRPVIPNLLFIRVTQSQIHELKGVYNSLLQFHMSLSSSNRKPLTVPDKQMRDLMLMYQKVDEAHREFYAIGEVALRADAKVKVKSGPLTGSVGYYQRIVSRVTRKGKRDKRFAVKLDGLLLCAAEVDGCEFYGLDE